MPAPEAQGGEASKARSGSLLAGPEPAPGAQPPAQQHGPAWSAARRGMDSASQKQGPEEELGAGQAT
ncbi:hypothetical protein NDU88_002453 [Pleurodeles waltl]|uniref:Uncharacterized protein n=1 Tax=Pleurodeles waltl TaxID=8319 RepID=A0AAV7T2X9_PLEWA|nr:hypothetical protein NDU88_002453 [Pleurodeles waltl]